MEGSDLGLLVALDALLQESSVTKAARRVGLSTPAMSHRLERLRVKLEDPLLVRAGRGMVLTPRAEALRPQVRSVVAAADRVMTPQAPFSPATLTRDFVIRATDYVLLVLGPTLDRIARAEAPQVGLRFMTNTPEDGADLRAGHAHLAVGIYGALEPELKTRTLLSDRFVCVVRRGHPLGRRRLTLSRYVKLGHIQVAPRGRPGGYVDDLLAERGLARRVTRAVPSFAAALRLVQGSDDVLTVSARVLGALEPEPALEVRAPPLPLEPYALSLLWHPRLDGDPAHRWLRELFVRAAAEVTGPPEPEARRRLAQSDPTGQR